MSARGLSLSRLGLAAATAALNGGLFLLLSGAGLSHADTTAPAPPAAELTPAAPDQVAIPELSEASTPPPPLPQEETGEETGDEAQADEEPFPVPFKHFGGY